MNNTRICVPVCASSASELPAAIERAAKLGDLVELRLDCLSANELDRLQRELPDLLKAQTPTLIFTLRPAGEGGRREIDNLTRVVFWTNFFSEETATKALADLELDLALHFQEQGRSLIDWQRVICSHHDFKGSSEEELFKLYERLSSTPARILKIAVQAKEITDCLPLFSLLDRAQAEGRELIAVAMGEQGLPTRILGPSRGSYLTYGSLDDEQQTAPGQIKAVELRELYRVGQLDRSAMITGLVGSPVAHSVSPQMHNAAFEAFGSNAVYLPFEVGEVAPFMRRMVHPLTCEIDWNLRGLSVTAPHKTAIMEHLDSVEPSAREIGAVNTVVVEDEKLRGLNTDAAAFIKTLSEKAGMLRGLNCALIGAGGAARGVLWGLHREGARATVFAREMRRAGMLSEEFAADCAVLAEARFDGYDVVINTTPLGTLGPLEDETPATAAQLRGARLVYDLVYNPLETRLLHEAKEAGCETMNGLPMLVAQAAEQFYCWTGRKAPVELMHRAAQTALEKLS
ncbi:MAG TPA: shikimate dehydrogenase [Pyrinomonadaceae bacterium]|jgi:3-dehydroquinate dehydratase/shikimate dehydrogenase